MARSKSLRGTLDILVLKALSGDNALSGFAIKQRIKRESGGVLHARDGSLYPALKRMKRAGWIQFYGVTTGRRRARVWELTDKGKKQFSEEKALWTTFSSTVNELLERQWKT